MTQGTKYDSSTAVTGTQSLTATSDKFQFIAPAGNVNVDLPDLRNATNTTTSGTGTVGTALYSDQSAGHFTISNTANAGEVITVRGWNGSSTTGTICTPARDETAYLDWTGNVSGWIGVAAADS